MSDDFPGRLGFVVGGEASTPPLAEETENKQITSRRSTTPATGRGWPCRKDYLPRPSPRC